MTQTDSEQLPSNLCLSPGELSRLPSCHQCIGPKSSSDAEADDVDADVFGVYAFDAGVDGYSDAGAVCVYAFGVDAEDADADAFGVMLLMLVLMTILILMLLMLMLMLMPLVFMLLMRCW